MSSEVIYGRHPVYEALKAGTRKFKKILIAKHFEGDIVNDIIKLAREKNVPVQHVDKQHLIGYSKNHQGVVAYVSQKEYMQYEQLLSKIKYKPDSVICILDEVEDPQNLGVVLRSALCFGVDGVIIQKRSAANISSGTVKASAGAIEYMPIVRVTNIVQAMEGLKKEGFWIYGADMSGEDIGKSKITGKVAIVIGNESSGLRQLTRQKCDFIVRIPIVEKISSLNAAISASVIFYELDRQRRGAKNC